MQIIAMLSMLIDHIGLVFFPDNLIWRIVGRLAFPLYAWFLVQGYKHTSNLKRYLLRLFYIFLAAQLPYMFALDLYQINVVGTLLVCLLILLAIDRAQSKLLASGIVAGVAVLLNVLPFDYGAYALFLILIFRFATVHMAVPLHFLLNVVYVFYLGWIMQLFSVAATACIIYIPYLVGKIDKIKLPRWAWRTFYPAHLFILAIIKFFGGI